MKSLHRFLAPLRIRSFRLFWLGQLISGLGDAAQTIALAWLVLNLTASPLAVSGALLAVILPRILFVFSGGVTVDQWDIRRVLLWSDLIRGGAIGLIALLAFVHSLPMPLLYGLLVIYGASGGFFFPAFYSVVPQLVSSENQQAANALNSLTSQLTIVLGAPLAGILIALFGPIPALAFNAISFGIAVLFTAQMPSLRRLERSTNELKRSPLKEASAGLVYLGSQTWLLSLLVMTACTNFAVSGLFSIGLPVLARTRPAVGVQGLGIILAGFGLGSIAGLFLAGALPQLRYRGLTLCLITLAKAPLYGLLALLPLPIVVLSLATAGLLNGVDEVAYTGVIQQKVPKVILGRVMSTVMLATFGLQPLSQLVTGIVASTVHIQILFFAAGIIILLSSLGGLLITELRKLD